VSNVASGRVLERCGYRFLDERALTVHLTGETYRFRYYRRERAAEGPGPAATRTPASRPKS
jgi:RimJ/RimL family protein N-acetyltransferase